MKWSQQKTSIKDTIQIVKADPFSPQSKKIVSKALPSLNEREINEIYMDSSEERRKKKAEEEKNNFWYPGKNET